MPYFKVTEMDEFTERSVLLSLPIEVLILIGHYLTPQDLLALSASCHHLRTTFNDNLLWRKFTHEGRVSLALDSATSVVSPLYEIPNCSSLEPLCTHRLHFLKQSRLLSNLRKNNFVQYSTEFNGFITDLETTISPWQQNITYGDMYLFAIEGKKAARNRVVKVYSIKSDLSLLTSFMVIKHEQYFHNVICGVFGNKLVVQQNYYWFDVYEIKLPDINFPLLHSINVKPSALYELGEMFTIGKRLFVENLTLNVVHLWDIDNGIKFENINPKCEGLQFCVFGYSEDCKCILFSEDILTKQNLFVYDVELLKFNSFNAVLNESKVHGSCGLVDKSHVVCVAKKGYSVCDVFVFDIHTSSMLVENTNIEGVNCNIHWANIINNFLVLPAMASVKIMNIKNLETVYELELDYLGMLNYIHLSNLCHLLIIYKNTDDAEIWDFGKKKKLNDFPSRLEITAAVSKIILCGDGKLMVRSFW